ncbi:MAG: hypothetical protein WD004_05355 [Actinomycetota bacterium]
MKSRNITDLLTFDEDSPQRETLVESDHLWSEVLCLQGAQEIGPIGDADADALFVVLAGEVMLIVAKSRDRLKQWESVVAPAGTQIYVKNASAEPAVVMVVTAPPPSGLPDEPPADEA